MSDLERISSFFHNPSLPAGTMDRDIDLPAAAPLPDFDSLRLRDQCYIVDSFTETLRDEIFDLEGGVDSAIIGQRLEAAWAKHRDAHLERMGAR